MVSRAAETAGACCGLLRVWQARTTSGVSAVLLTSHPEEGSRSNTAV